MVLTKIEIDSDTLRTSEEDIARHNTVLGKGTEEEIYAFYNLINGSIVDAISHIVSLSVFNDNSFNSKVNGLCGRHSE